MSRVARSWLGALAWALVACGAPEEPLYRAPAEARAAWLLEPPVVAVGEVATLDLAVVTAPEVALPPFELPGSVDGFFVLEREPLQVERQPARWVHHTRLRLRAVEVGRFEVQGGSLDLSAPEGGGAVLHYEPLELQVVSVLDGASRTTPWGIRLLEPTRRGGSGSWGSFAAGVGVSLIGLAVALLVRRRLARPSDPVAGAPDAATQPRVAEIARADLAAARAQLAGDPQRALDEASRALRRYAVRRFGGDAHVRTTEELALAEPPFLLTTRWPRFLALLSALDAARFSPTQADAAGAASGRARELFDQVESFVTDSSPAERDA